MAFLTHYKQYIDYLTQTEKICIETMINEKLVDERTSIVYLAQQLNVSASTIFRTIRKLGYDSFIEFKMEFIYYKYPLTNKNKITEDSLLKDLQSDFDDTIRLLKQVDYNQIIPNLMKAKTVLIASEGMNHYLARILETKLRMNRISAIHFSNSWFAEMEVLKMGQDDCLIILSKTGETQELIELAKTAKVNKVKIILISEFVDSTIKKYADDHIPVSKSVNEGVDIDTRLQLHIAIHYLMKKIVYFDYTK